MISAQAVIIVHIYPFLAAYTGNPKEYPLKLYNAKTGVSVMGYFYVAVNIGLPSFAFT